MDKAPKWFDQVDAFRSPNEGGGVFISARARKSATSAHRALHSNNTLGKMRLSEHRKLKSKLVSISNRYWADWDYDHRKSIAEVKKELESLKPSLTSVSNAINSLSFDTKKAIEEKRIWDTHSRVPLNFVENSIEMIDALKETTDSLIALHKPKGTASAVRSCCSSLWDLRESMTGKPFKRVYKLERGRKGNATEGFAADDARFVSVVMTSIDGEVSHQTIRTKLMEVARKKPKAKAAATPS